MEMKIEEKRREERKKRFEFEPLRVFSSSRRRAAREDERTRGREDEKTRGREDERTRKL